MADERLVRIVLDILNDPKEPFLRVTKEQVEEFINYADADALPPPLTSGPHQDGWKHWAIMKMIHKLADTQDRNV